MVRIRTGGGAAGRSPGLSQLALEPSLITEAGQALRITLYNSAAGAGVRLSGLILDADGIRSFEENFTPASDRSPQVFFSPLVAGSVKNIRLGISAGTVHRGQCFGRVELAAAAGPTSQILQTILAGYLTTGVGISFPGSPIERPTEGPGILAGYAMPNDPITNFPTGIVPVNARWRVVGSTFLLACAAAGVARHVNFGVISGGNGAVVTDHTAALPAGSNTLVELISAGYAQPILVGGGGPGIDVTAVNLGREIFAGPGGRFQWAIINLNPADLPQLAFIFVEEWIDV